MEQCKVPLFTHTHTHTHTHTEYIIVLTSLISLLPSLSLSLLLVCRCLHFQSLMDTLRDDCNVTMTTNCTQQCSDNQKEAEKSMGCCLATLLSVTQTSSPCPLPSSQVCSSAHRLSKLLPSLLPLILVTIATNMN